MKICSGPGAWTGWGEVAMQLVAQPRAGTGGWMLSASLVAS